MSEGHIWKVAQSVGFDDYELRPMLEAFAAALSQSAPSPQPAVPVDEQMTPSFAQLKQILDSLDRCHHRDSKAEFLRTWIRDWAENKVSRAVLAMRPAVEPMTLEQMADAIEHLCANREIAEILAANSADEYRAIAAKAQGVRDAS